jgi:hypothetical protein
VSSPPHRSDRAGARYSERLHSEVCCFFHIAVVVAQCGSGYAERLPLAGTWTVRQALMVWDLGLVLWGLSLNCLNVVLWWPPRGDRSSGDDK